MQTRKGWFLRTAPIGEYLKEQWPLSMTGRRCPAGFLGPTGPEPLPMASFFQGQGAYYQPPFVPNWPAWWGQAPEGETYPRPAHQHGVCLGVSKSKVGAYDARTSLSSSSMPPPGFDPSVHGPSLKASLLDFYRRHAPEQLEQNFVDGLVGTFRGRCLNMHCWWLVLCGARRTRGRTRCPPT